MANESYRVSNGPILPRVESGRLLSPESVAGHVENLVLTEEGSLRTVNGPAMLTVPYKADGQESVYASYPAGNMRGIFHCRLENGARDVLLAHYVNSLGVNAVMELQGWEGNTMGYVVVGGIVGVLYGGPYPLPELSDRAEFPTQFVAAPNGVIIIPQGGRTYWYDGYTVVPFGYDAPPAAPTPFGASVAATAGTDVDRPVADTEEGYNHTGENMLLPFGMSRIGTVSSLPVDVFPDAAAGKNKLSNPLGGVRKQGEWRAAVQLVDKWGNLSPLSSLSEPARMVKKDNLTKERKSDDPESADRLRGQILWSSVAPGERRTVGRILYRTHDLNNTLLPGLFEVPSYAAAGRYNFATLPDNTTTLWPDNVPDAWLLASPIEVDAVPQFKLGVMALGVFWAANWPGAPGGIRPSLPGRWATFPRGQVIYPDVTGSEITGLLSTQWGLLVFSETSVFLVTPNAEGTGFRVSTLRDNVGCSAPNSVATLPSGAAVWLGPKGWYAFDGTQITPISLDIQDTVVRRLAVGGLRAAVAAVDEAAGEYRCWVPVDGSKYNNLCVVFDGTGWRERSDVNAQAVCVTRDHRKYMVALGTVDVRKTNVSPEVEVDDYPGLWVLDVESNGVFMPREHTAVFETGWLTTDWKSAKSGMSVTLWLRETKNANLTIEVMRDW